MPSAVFAPLRPQRNLSGELAGRLAGEIVAGRLAPGARLPTEQVLIRTYGVSRTVVREAIAALRADGLVETRQGSGAFVPIDTRRRPFRIDPEGLQSIAQVIDLMELRICVEVEAAGIAAERRTKAHSDRIAAIGLAFAKAVKAGDPAVDLDYDFHAAIGAATRNPFFSSFLEFIGRIIIPRRTVQIDPNDPARSIPYLRKIQREHEAIARAIAAGNVTAARLAMRDHLTQGRERYRRLMTEGATRAGRRRPVGP